jgi:hypothetical protein
MEQLKPLNEICQADARHQYSVVLDNSLGDFRPLSLEDVYDIAERINLHDGVPDRIRTHFQTARNLYVYSWFYYPFNVTAQLHAFLSAEFALKVKSGAQTGGFRRLLKRALPYLRNELAHGSTMLHNRGAEYLGICAELINQLFDEIADPGDLDITGEE